MQTQFISACEHVEEYVLFSQLLMMTMKNNLMLKRQKLVIARNHTLSQKLREQRAGFFCEGNLHHKRTLKWADNFYC